MSSGNGIHVASAGRDYDVLLKIVLIGDSG